MNKTLLLVIVVVFTRALVAQTPVWIKNPANGHYYALTSKGTMTWSSADREARGTHGVYLATVRSKAENDWIKQTFLSSSSPRVWLGLTDHVKEGTFAWSTGQPLTYSDWHYTQPQNNETKDYVYLVISGWFVEQGTLTAFGLMERIDADFSTFGRGCASTTTLPTISSTTPPKLGQSFGLSIKGFLPKPQFGQLIVGRSNTHWASSRCQCP